MGRLVKNELFKIIKQKGYLVLIILLLVGFLISPVIAFFTANMTIDKVKNSSDDYKEAKSESKAYSLNPEIRDEYLAKADGIKQFTSHYPEWKYRLYGDAYVALYSYLVVNKDKSGTSEYAQIQTALAELEKKIGDDTEYNHNKENYDKYVMFSDKYKSLYDSSKEAFDSNNEKTVNEYNMRKTQYELSLMLVECAKIMVDTNVEPLSWKTFASEEAYKLITSLEYEYPSITKKEFADDGMESKYNDYINERNGAVKYIIENTNKYLYSIKNNIKITNSSITGEISNKNIIRNAYTTVEGLLWLVFAVIGAGSVASELSRGTGRLLLIRPVKRSAIINAKIIAVILYYIFVALTGVLLELIMTMICYGIGDIFVSNTIYVFNTVVAVPFIFSFFKLFIEKFVVVLFYALVAILFSILTKRTVVSVIIIYAIKSGAGTIYSILTFIQNFVSIPKWINYTPIAFLDGIGSNGELIDTILSEIGLGSKISYGYFYNWLGVLYYLLECLIIFLLVHKAFKKAQL